VIERRLAPPPASAVPRPRQRLALAPTRRAAILLAAGVVFLVPAWIDRRAALLILAWNGIVIGAMAADAGRLPRAAALVVTRHWSGPLTIGSNVTVSLGLENHSGHDVAARLTDYLDAGLRPAIESATVRVPSRRSATVTYQVAPRDRGDLQAGDVLVEWRSTWGLVERWAHADVAQQVRVYPDLQEGRRHSMYLIRSRQIALQKRRARRATGGREFDRLREYRDGDDRRDVSWIVSARRAHLVTKVYQPERSQTVWLLVDAGRLLRARSAGQTLLDRAATAAIALAQVAMTSGDNVGVIAYGRRVQHRLTPSRGPAQLRRIIEAMALTHANALCEPRLSAYMTAISRRRWRPQLEPSSARTGYQSRSFMTDDAETRRRRAAYRAAHRGTKEMDWVLGRFAEQALADMEGARLAAFEELLELPDPALHQMVMDGVPVADQGLAALIAEIRAFHGLGGAT